jgi:hypothetical protein
MVSAGDTTRVKLSTAFAAILSRIHIGRRPRLIARSRQPEFVFKRFAKSRLTGANN